MPSSAALLHIDLMNKDRIKVTYSTKLDSIDLDLIPLLDSLPSTNVIRLKTGTLTITIDNPNAAPFSSSSKLPGQSIPSPSKPVSTLSSTSTKVTAAHPQYATSSPSPTPGKTSVGTGGYSSITGKMEVSGGKMGVWSPSGSSGSGKVPSVAQTAATSSTRPSGAGGATSAGAAAAASGKRPKWLKKPAQLQTSLPPPPAETEDFALYDPTISRLDADEAWVPPTALPEKYEETEAELFEKAKRWARFATFMAKPFNYDSKYKRYLQQLDAMGAINLKRITREQIPNLNVNFCAALFFNPYEDLPHTLDMGPINDALLMAELFISRGYRVVYMCDATPYEYYRWMDWLLDNVELELVSFFSGHGTQIPDKTGREADGLSEVLVFYDETRKKQAKGAAVPKITPVKGITKETVDDTCMFDLITSKQYPQTRVILLTDCCHSGTMFNMDQKPSQTNLLTPPPSVICVGSALDSQTAKQTSFAGRETGVFTHNFVELLKKTPTSSFLDLQRYMSTQIKKFQTIQLTSMKETLFRDPIIPQLGESDGEIQLNDIDDTLLGMDPAHIVSIPEEDIPSQVEQEIAALRWADFCAELAKPAPYSSKYKKYLQQLDAMGAINLERITRAQIPPNIYINHCAALFINPYEGLPHTLDAGPLGDAVLLSELFLSRGYHVVYMCDATPHEYYRWMDWLLNNVETELVSFFSGHGTQIPDTTGKEADGLSEVLVFYDSKRKKQAKGAAVPKITPVKGITNETVDDTCMFDLITSKQYPQTRVVLLTDCCHSGTMFNMDQSIPPNAQGITPPINVVCVGSAQDSQTAKQTSFQGTEAGVFTYNFSKLLKEKPQTTFLELRSYMDRQIKKYQTIQLTSSSPTLLRNPIIVDNDQ